MGSEIEYRLRSEYAQEETLRVVRELQQKGFSISRGSPTLSRRSVLPPYESLTPSWKRQGTPGGREPSPVPRRSAGTAQATKKCRPGASKRFVEFSHESANGYPFYLTPRSLSLTDYPDVHQSTPDSNMRPSRPATPPPLPPRRRGCSLAQPMVPSPHGQNMTKGPPQSAARTSTPLRSLTARSHPLEAIAEGDRSVSNEGIYANTSFTSARSSSSRPSDSGFQDLPRSSFWTSMPNVLRPQTPPCDIRMTRSRTRAEAARAAADRRAEASLIDNSHFWSSDESD